MKIFILAVLLAFSGNCFAIVSELGSECTEAGSPCMMKKVEEEYKKLDERINRIRRSSTNSNNNSKQESKINIEDLSEYGAFNYNDFEQIDIKKSSYRNLNKSLSKGHLGKMGIIDKLVHVNVYKVNNSEEIVKAMIDPLAFEKAEFPLFGENVTDLKADKCNVLSNDEGAFASYMCEIRARFDIAKGADDYYYGKISNRDEIGIIKKVYFSFDLNSNELLIVNEYDKDGDEILAFIPIIDSIK